MLFTSNANAFLFYACSMVIATLLAAQTVLTKVVIDFALE